MVPYGAYEEPAPASAPVSASLRFFDVLKSGGLLAGSAFTLDIEGVSTLRFGRELIPLRGVFGAISNLRYYE